MKRLILVALTLLIPTVALAQTEVSALTSFIAGRGKSDGTIFRTPHLGLTLNHFWTDKWSTELGLFRSEETFRTLEWLSPTRVTINSEEYDIYPVTAAVQYHFFDSRWRPYIGAGFIFAGSPREIRDTALDHGDITRLMLDFGLTYSVTDKLGLRVDVKYSPIGWGPPVLEGYTPTLGLKLRF